MEISRTAKLTLFLQLTSSKYLPIYQKYGEDAVIDPTSHEIAAMRAVIKPLSEYIEHDMGWETPLNDYDRQEILTLIEVVVTAYHEALTKATETQWPDLSKSSNLKVK